MRFRRRECCAAGGLLPSRHSVWVIKRRAEYKKRGSNEMSGSFFFRQQYIAVRPLHYTVWAGHAVPPPIPVREFNRWHLAVLILISDFSISKKQD
jgi:hypothetical protein